MNIPNVQPRNVARINREISELMWLVNEDLDAHDRMIAGLRDELRNTNKILFGLLVTIASAAIVGALNLVFNAV